MEENPENVVVFEEKVDVSLPLLLHFTQGAQRSGERGVTSLLSLPVCIHCAKSSIPFFTIPSPSLHTRFILRAEICAMKNKTDRIIPSILLVDDEEDVLEFLSWQLRQAGYRVIATNQPDEAITILEEEEPWAVVSDVLMDPIDGLELCRRIKSKINGRFIPVVLISSSSELSVVSGAHHAGADHFIPKHLVMDELNEYLGLVVRA